MTFRENIILPGTTIPLTTSFSITDIEMHATRIIRSKMYTITIVLEDDELLSDVQTKVSGISELSDDMFQTFAEIDLEDAEEQEDE